MLVDLGLKCSKLVLDIYHAVQEWFIARLGTARLLMSSAKYSVYVSVQPSYPKTAAAQNLVQRIACELWVIWLLGLTFFNLFNLSVKSESFYRLQCNV